MSARYSPDADHRLPTPPAGAGPPIGIPLAGNLEMSGCDALAAIPRALLVLARQGVDSAASLGRTGCSHPSVVLTLALDDFAGDAVDLGFVLDPVRVAHLDFVAAIVAVDFEDGITLRFELG